jgi:hypothetical protein
MAGVARSALLVLVWLAAGCAARAPARPSFDAGEFRALMMRLSDAWRRGDARLAADCFAVDAVYIEPPRTQAHVGRAALYELFGGAAGRPGRRSMTWRSLLFDPASQRGAGEFTFAFGSQVHGVAVIDVRGGRIAQWREYWSEASLEAAF